MDRQELQNVEWEKTDLLNGMDEDNILKIKKYLQKINFESIENDDVVNYIAPSVIRIVLSIINKKHKLYSTTDNGMSEKRALSLIDVDDIIKSLTEFFVDYMPITYKRFPHVEVIPDLMRMFCDNYVIGLTKI